MHIELNQGIEASGARKEDVHKSLDSWRNTTVR